MKEHKNWEYFFQDAILSVEELLSKHNAQSNHFSKLKIALDNHFLTWFEYKEWAKDYYGVPVLNIDRPESIEILKQQYLAHQNQIKAPDIWSKELIPVSQWDNQLIVFGIEPTEKIQQLKDYIFILTPPQIIEQIIAPQNTISADAQQIEPNEQETIIEHATNMSLQIPEIMDLPKIELASAEVQSDDLLTLDENTPNDLTNTEHGLLSLEEIIEPIKLEPIPSPATVITETTTPQEQDAEESVSLFKNSKDQPQSVTDRIWDNLAAHHDDYAMTARKQFDAYLVLRVTPEETTEVYKMDEDLAKEDINFNVFKYDLKKANPFHNVYQKHFTETFNINQLGLKILDFKYACVSVIKLGKKVVGFLVGFKTTHLSQEDISTLESISEKVV